VLLIIQAYCPENIEVMDSNTSLLSGSDDEARPAMSSLLVIISFLVFLIPACFMSYELFAALHNAGRMKFSLEPIAYTGLESAGDVALFASACLADKSWLKVLLTDLV